jgi:hypothetical protein
VKTMNSRVGDCEYSGVAGPTDSVSLIAKENTNHMEFQIGPGPGMERCSLRGTQGHARS